MDFSGRRQKAVDNRQRTAGAQPAPFIGNSAIDWQNAFTKGLINGYKPVLKRICLGGVLQSDSFDASADFADHQHAQIQTLVLDPFVPARDIGVAPFALMEGCTGGS
jgi:hypothetical protein